MHTQTKIKGIVSLVLLIIFIWVFYGSNGSQNEALVAIGSLSFLFGCLLLIWFLFDWKKDKTIYAPKIMSAETGRAAQGVTLVYFSYRVMTNYIGLSVALLLMATVSILIGNLLSVIIGIILLVSLILVISATIKKFKKYKEIIKENS
jgi:hypothetical protein